MVVAGRFSSLTTWIAIAAVVPLLVVAAATPADVRPAPQLLDLRVGNGSIPFAGDRRLFTTVTPNGDGLRDRAVVRFRLDAPARVRLDVVRTDSPTAAAPLLETIWSKTAKRRRGTARLVWRPRPDTPERTYSLRLMVTGSNGARRLYGLARPGPRPHLVAPVVRVLGVEVRFSRQSYAPGQSADVSVTTDARSLRFQVFSLTRIPRPTEQDLKSGGEAMTPAVRLDWRGHANRPNLVHVVPGEWPSGLYILRLTANDGRVGYAPFILRPRNLGAHRVAVVLSTNTWQASNLDDANGDGWGDSWYVSDQVPTIDLRRPYLDFGNPLRYRDWDLTVVSWLSATRKQVDYLSDDDLGRLESGRDLARRYDLLVFPGHEEYVTQHVYDLVQRYRDLGGNLLFLAANNFFWKVVRRGPYLTRVDEWRRLGRPEASLVGVQLNADYGRRRAPYVVTGVRRDPWAFAGTGLQNGGRLGRYGFEVDKRAAASPRGTRVLAAIASLPGPGRDAEMTYYETARGAKVFAAGTLDFAGSLDRPVVSRLLENIWSRLTRP